MTSLDLISLIFKINKFISVTSISFLYVYDDSFRCYAKVSSLSLGFKHTAHRHLPQSSGLVLVSHKSKARVTLPEIFDAVLLSLRVCISKELFQLQNYLDF